MALFTSDCDAMRSPSLLQVAASYEVVLSLLAGLLAIGLLDTFFESDTALTAEHSRLNMIWDFLFKYPMLVSAPYLVGWWDPHEGSLAKAMPFCTRTPPFACRRALLALFVSHILSGRVWRDAAVTTGAGPPQHGLYSDTVALITSGRDTICSPGINWP